MKLFENYLNELRTLSSEIWHHPELRFQETFAHDSITDFFIRNNIGKVTKSTFKLQTSFKVEYVTGGGNGEVTHPNDQQQRLPCVAFFSEFDALPNVGHACGHNLIAIVGITAFIKLINYLESQSIAAKVVLLGSPGEEGGYGKVYMVEEGALEGVDFALMAHPCPYDAVEVTTLAIDSIHATFHGKSAHGVVPWEGLNALDAAVLAYTNINTLRHRMEPTWKAHGVFTDGGKAPNVIPDRAQLYFCFRAPQTNDLLKLLKMAESCFEAGASATGCTVDLTYGKLCESVVQNPVLGRLYKKYMKEEKGGKFPPDGEIPFRGSTDMGNVTRTVPGLHAYYEIDCHGAEHHSVEFGAAAILPQSFDRSIDAAESLAHAAFEVLSSKELFDEMKATFNEMKMATKS